MTEKINQINIKLDAASSEALSQMAKEANSTITTVARQLLFAAIRQAEQNHQGQLPPHLLRFYGIVPGPDE